MGWRWVAAREAFAHMASPSSSAAPKVLLERKHKHTLFPKLIVQLGLPIFLPLMGLCIRPRGVGLQACFAQGVCLWVTLNYHHNSKNCMYILSAWLKSWGIVSNFCLPNYLRLQSSGVSTESRVMCIPQSEEVPASGIKWGGEEVRLNSSNLPIWTKTIKRLHTFLGLRNAPISSYRNGNKIEIPFSKLSTLTTSQSTGAAVSYLRDDLAGTPLETCSLRQF